MYVTNGDFLQFQKKTWTDESDYGTPITDEDLNRLEFSCLSVTNFINSNYLTSEVYVLAGNSTAEDWLTSESAGRNGAFVIKRSGFCHLVVNGGTEWGPSVPSSSLTTVTTLPEQYKPLVTTVGVWVAGDKTFGIGVVRLDGQVQFQTMGGDAASSKYYRFSITYPAAT